MLFTCRPRNAGLLHTGYKRRCCPTMFLAWRGLVLLFSFLASSTGTMAASEPVTMTPGQSCLDCHGQLNTPKHIHPATEGGKDCATLCHLQADPARHQFAAPPEPIVSLCLECHQDDFKDTVVHGPVASGDCVACHDPHASDEPKLLREPIPALCWRCHDKGQTDAAGIPLPPTKPLFENSKATLHPPFAEGGCNDCHRPHASAEARLLTAAFPAGLYQAFSKTAYALCLNCHDAEAFSEPRTETATAFRNGNLNLHQRHVDKEKGRSCRACHTPHGNEQPHLITGGFRFGERVLGLTYEATDNGGSCVSNCHVKVSYDRVAPVNNPLRTSPRQGEDAKPKDAPAPGTDQKK